MKNLPDGDYVLTESAAWFESPGRKVSVRLRFLADCVEVVTYKHGAEMDPPLDTAHLPYPYERQ